MDSHLVPLDGRWSMWRWVCLRGAGFPFHRLDALASPALARAADSGDGPAYAAEFGRASRDLSRALHDVAADPRFREAVAWQNRSALDAGIAALLRRDPSAPPRGSRDRSNAALVARYLQRYCAKNDTIGFFGPAGWAEIRDGGPAVSMSVAPPGALARRTVHFEAWAVRAVAEAHASGVRPWLVPRRSPGLAVGEAWVRPPFAPAVPVGELTARVLGLVDGERAALDIVALAGPDALRILGELHDRGWVAWTLDVAPCDLAPEEGVRARLRTVGDAALRAPALAALDELVAARDAVAGAAPATLPVALAGLDATFHRLTGTAPTRRPGETYAGRTLVFLECLRAGEVLFGQSILDTVRRPLALVLEAARWFTAAAATVVHRACLDLYRSRGGGTVPLAEFWLLAHDLIFELPASVVGPLVRALTDRWARVLPGSGGGRRLTLHSGSIVDAVRREFAVARPGWAAAVHHSPDLMLGAASVDAINEGDVQWVLGELHPGMNTLRYASRVALHPDPDALRRAAATDRGRPVVVLAPSSERGMPARQSNGLAGPEDVWLVFANDSNGYDPARTLFVGECDLVESRGKLFVRDRMGRHTLDLIEILADALSHHLVQHFRIYPAWVGGHTPRVTIDGLVVVREAWTFAPSALAFAHAADAAARFLAVRHWMRDHSIPRYVFLRATGDGKPIFVDLSSLASVDLLSRVVRRAAQRADTAWVTVTEMLPTPDQLWLADADGQRYTCELRVCAVDGGPVDQPASR